MLVKEAIAEAADQKAAGYLKDRGFQILDRNWRSDSDILPLVAVERDTLVIVDLQVRAGAPLEGIAEDRQRRMRLLGARWMAERMVRFARIRIDTVGVRCDGPRGFTIEHIRAVG